jgi:hypothetical protein
VEVGKVVRQYREEVDHAHGLGCVFQRLLPPGGLLGGQRSFDVGIRVDEPVTSCRRVIVNINGPTPEPKPKLDHTNQDAVTNGSPLRHRVHDDEAEEELEGEDGHGDSLHELYICGGFGVRVSKVRSVRKLVDNRLYIRERLFASTSTGQSARRVHKND